MDTMNLRDLFNERKWHTGDLAVLTVVVRHRGAPGDERRLPGAQIVEIGSAGLVVDGGEEGSVFLPWHRVLRVVAPEAVLWERT
jgi:uncharacterized protein (UPF0248 family)